MSRISNVLANLRSKNKKALIPYLTAGDPNPSETVSLMHLLADEGADIIELGVPFSDPMADGPTIQLACERALKHNVSLKQVLEMVADFRRDDSVTPVVLMGYLNPIERMGYESFVEMASHCGVDGVLAVDLPPEEAADWNQMLSEKAMDAIFLLSPTTTKERAAKILAATTGYAYYVSLKGVTGSADLNVTDVQERVEALKALSDKPVAIGFGIRNGEMAGKLAAIADGVIVGSELVKQIEQNPSDKSTRELSIRALMKDLRQGVDSAKS